MLHPLQPTVGQLRRGLHVVLDVLFAAGHGLTEVQLL
jgi:hypothetical protein